MAIGPTSSNGGRPGRCRSWIASGRGFWRRAVRSCGFSISASPAPEHKEDIDAQAIAAAAADRRGDPSDTDPPIDDGLVLEFVRPRGAIVTVKLVKSLPMPDHPRGNSEETRRGWAAQAGRRLPLPMSPAAESVVNDQDAARALKYALASMR